MAGDDEQEQQNLVAATQMTTWRNRIVGHGEEDPAQLLANPFNFRIHSKMQQQSMTTVLDAVGWIQDVIVNITTQHMLDGHMRVGLALQRGEPRVPVKYVELTEEEERIVLVTFDPLGDLATLDREKQRELAQRVSDESQATSELVRRLHSKAMVADTRMTPEMRLSPEINERQDYLVVLCTNELDWRVLCDKLGITTSRDGDANAETQTGKAFGLGRVITAAELLGKLA